MAAERVSLDINDLVRRYLAGESVKQASKRLGVGRPTIIRRLANAGVTIRNRSEAMFNRMAVTPKSERTRLASFAHNAIRGKRQSNEHRIKIAKTRESLAVPVGAHRKLMNLLKERGLTCIAEKAVDRYNLDIAATEYPVAVELFGGGWHGNGRHANRFPDRTEFLLNQGWNLIIVWLEERRTKNLIAAADYIVTYCKKLCEKESTRSEYLVIRGDGKTPAFGCNDRDGRPVIPSLARRDSATGRYASAWQ